MFSWEEERATRLRFWRPGDVEIKGTTGMHPDTHSRTFHSLSSTNRILQPRSLVFQSRSASKEVFQKPPTVRGVAASEAPNKGEMKCFFFRPSPRPRPHAVAFSQGSTQLDLNKKVSSATSQDGLPLFPSLLKYIVG